MNFTKLIPSVFYADINDGLTLFVECLEFVIAHQELDTQQPFCVLIKGELCIYLFQDIHQAAIDHPELRLETNNIEEVFRRVQQSHPELLHPNLAQITLRPWGAREFALMDAQLGIRIQQW